MEPETLEEAKRIFGAIKRNVSKKSDCIICPPALFLPSLFRLNTESGLSLGVQDVFFEKEGHFTGFLSANMLQKAGADYAIIGHSERRMRGESDEEVNKKALSALKARLQVILCVGESARDQSGRFLEFIQMQLKHSLLGLKKSDVKRIMVAYEPVWAIGASEAMNPRDLHQMTLFIRKVLTELFGKEAAYPVPILYGGSVNDENCAEIICEGEADGLLVGRASLDPKEFIRIADTVGNVTCPIRG